jgi:hypothetical protein
LAQLALLVEEERDDLPLVNLLCEDVKRWREANYRNATPMGPWGRGSGGSECFPWYFLIRYRVPLQERVRGETAFQSVATQAGRLAALFVKFPGKVRRLVST